MKIGIVNAGNIGRTLARVWHDAGHDLLLAKAGDQTKLNRFMPEVASAQNGSPLQAAEFGDVILFSVYWPRFEETLEEVGDLRGKIVIDTMNPLNVNEEFEHYHDTEFMTNNSTSEELQKRLPGAMVVKAFGTMPAPVLDAKQWQDNAIAPPIFVASDHEDAKEKVMQLVQDAGFEPFDAGPLAASRSIEQLGVLLHHVGTHHFKGEYSRLAPTFLQATRVAETD